MTGMNNAVEKGKLLKNMKASFKEIEKSRWLATEEGQRYLTEQAHKHQISELKKQFQIGQLVWRDDIQDDPTLMTNGKIVNVCNKIVEINDETINTEMMYGVVEEERIESYVDWDSLAHLKGEIHTYHFFRLERHFSKKSGNVWWKIK